MSILSKTGLVPTPKKETFEYFEKRKKTFENFVLSANVAKPVEFSLRPFGGLFNPYSKGCSVLCNHPAPSAVRSVIRKAKDSWSSEGKNFYGSHKENFESAQFDTTGQIPEELFRRYTDTDSRPLTPSPASASVRTKTSGGSFFNTRRCVTPEPGKDSISKRKKIILDLRRSHSQETVYWKASSEVSQGFPIEPQSNLILNERKEKAEEIPKLEPIKKKVTEPVSEEPPPVEDKSQQICINEREVDEEEALQRRGKKRRKTKQLQATATFHLSQDPETQIAALGPDSLNASTRPSLIPNASLLLASSENKEENGPRLLKDSFLSDEAFKVLKTELDIDVVENTFERYLNRAFREAIKYITPKKKNIPEKYTNKETLKDLYFEHNRNTMPRKLSKSAARFEMPLNLQFLEYLTVFEYLSLHVWVSRQRKQIFRKTFLKYISKDDLDEAGDPLPSTERRIPLVNFRKALNEVLGFYSSEEVIERVCELVEIDKYSEINFRSWCGVVAFAERLAVKDAQSTDSCDELEKSDFDSLEQRLGVLDITPNMKSVFEVIRKGHCFVGRC